MSEVLPITNPLKKMQAHFVERKWMRAAKAWRCFLSLPEHPAVLPSMLTALIDSKVCAEIHGGVDVTISPAFIVDVPSKGRKFSLVLETCFEYQTNLGPYLTALTDSPVTLTIAKFVEPVVARNADFNTLTADELRGLHLGFFRNPRFWDYLAVITKREEPIQDEHAAKAAFKAFLQVGSCKDINRTSFTDFIAAFNAWIKERAHG